MTKHNRYKMKGTIEGWIAVVDTKHPDFKDVPTLSAHDHCVMAHWMTYPVPVSDGKTMNQLETQDSCQCAYLLHQLNSLNDAVLQAALEINAATDMLSRYSEYVKMAREKQGLPTT